MEIDHHSGVPIYRQVIRQIRRQIMTDGLQQGDQFETVRCLAARLKVNPMTVSKAYSFLEAEGLVERKRGIGLCLPDTGSSATFAADAAGLTPDELAKIGYVHQEGELLDWMTVKQLIRYVAAYYDNWNHDLEAEYIDDFDIDVTRRVGTLSPGQRQKLAILLAIGFEPELLILDEPASALDPLARSRCHRRRLLGNLHSRPPPHLQTPLPRAPIRAIRCGPSAPCTHATISAMHRPFVSRGLPQSTDHKTDRSISRQRPPLRSRVFSTAQVSPATRKPPQHWTKEGSMPNQSASTLMPSSARQTHKFSRLCRTPILR